jgi:branched-subunit amino acid aminotransferase/4-amino-4-deoxychorismate lyase
MWKAWKLDFKTESLQPISLEIGDDSMNLDEISRQLPGGVYTTLRTYHRLQALNLERHFDRLERSAHRIGYDIKVARQEIRSGIRQMIDCTTETGDFRSRIMQ